MRQFVLIALAAFLSTTALIGVAHAQARPDTEPAERQAQLAAEVHPGPAPLQVDVGVGSFFAPAFIGSKDYQLFAAPLLSLRYKDRVFFSVQEGLGVELIKTDRFKAGPAVSFQGSRRENNGNPFRIAGDGSTALRGLGTVSASAGLGGFAEYRLDKLTARLDIRKQVSGSDGLSGTFDVKYNQIIPRVSGRPIILSIGPRVTFVDDHYNSAYFGVTALQSARSGLPVYKAEGGLLSAGIGGAVIVPVARPVNLFLFAGYDRLAGDAARSPLVERRGSRDQPSVGLGLSYHFGAF